MENIHAKEPKDGGAVSPPLPYLAIAASPHIMAKSYGKLGGAPGWTRGREPHPCAFTCRQKTLKSGGSGQLLNSSQCFDLNSEIIDEKSLVPSA